MKEDTTELEFREMLKECLTAIKGFEDFYIDKTEEWLLFFPKEDREIMNSIINIKHSLEKASQDSINRDLKPYE